MTDHHVSLRVNGAPREATVEARTTLAEMLRDNLGLTGTHVGCEHGVCGSCTVLVDGDAVRACLQFAVQTNGRDVVTVEGLAHEDNGQLVMHPLQQAFYDAISFQCGFCTPGVIMSTLAALRERVADGATLALDDREIREMLAGNLCRCTGYSAIVDGVRVALSNGAATAKLPHEK